MISHGPDALPTTRLSTKGRVILPKSVREAEALEPGAEFTVEKVPEGILLRPLKTAPSRIEDVSGCLRYRGKPKSVAEMNRAIAMQIRERHGRGRGPVLHSRSAWSSGQVHDDAVQSPVSYDR